MRCVPGPGLVALVLVAAATLGAAAHAQCPKGWKKHQANVRSGETIEAFAKRVGVALADLKKWNRLKSDGVRPKQNLVFCRRQEAAGSIGSPGHGKLVGGVHIDPDNDCKGTGFVIGDGRTRLYGTRETVAYVKQCGREYRKAFSRAKGPPFNVGDLSPKNGGSAGPHVSHESGRDVDIGYMTRPPQGKGAFDRTATCAADLDLPKQWVITRCFLDIPATKVIFMGRGVFEALKAHVAKVYRKQPSLKKKYLSALARLVAPDDEHLSHMHVRFKCPKTDKRCVE